jgi:hypothetical protein
VFVSGGSFLYGSIIPQGQGGVKENLAFFTEENAGAPRADA